MAVFFIISGILAALLGSPAGLVIGAVLIGTGAVTHRVDKLRDDLEL